MTPTKRFLFLLLFTVIGIVFGIGFGIAFFYIRRKKDDEITISGSINEVIVPSISFWVTIGILLIIKCAYGIPLKIFVMSGIILASFLSAISIKKAWLFFLGFGAVVLELIREQLFTMVIDYLNNRAKQMKAENNTPSEQGKLPNKE
jgi:hypothetical protein